MKNKSNVGRPFVDLYKKLSTSVGVVPNLYGNVFEPFSTTTPKFGRGWYFFSVPAGRLLSLAEIYDAGSISNVASEFLPVDSSNVADISSIFESQEEKVTLLFTGMQVPYPGRVSVEVQALNSDIVLYVNNAKVVETSNNLTGSFFLQDSVKSIVQVVIHRKKLGGGGEVAYQEGYIRFDSNVPVILSPPTPDVVEWVPEEDGPIIFGNLSPTDASPGLILSWNDSPFVGGWIIERTSYEAAGVVYDYVTSGTSYVFMVSGTLLPQDQALVTVGEQIVGLVTDVDIQPGESEITVSGFVEDDPAWIGETLFFYKETSTPSEVTRANVQDEGTVIRYVDNAITEGIPYTYRVAAWSVVDKALIGEYSTAKTKLAFDDTPPGPIELWPTDDESVTVEGDLVTVEHIYPPDPDLAGYRIYQGTQDDLVADLRPGNEFMVLGGRPSGVANPPERYGVFTFRVRDLSGVEVERIVDGYVVTTYDFAGNELPFASGTSLSFRLFVDVPENFTAYDNVSSPTKAQRRPDTVPDHMWQTAIDIFEESKFKVGDL